MASSSFGPAASVATRPPVENPRHHTNKAGTAIFSYTCVGLTGTAVFCVLFFFFCHRIRSRSRAARVDDTAAEEINGDRRPDPNRRRSVDLAKLREFAYSRSARRGGGDDEAAAAAQCSVCLGAVQGGEMVRRLPACKHLYHVECIDMWLASHDTCPLCRSEVAVVVLPPDDTADQLPV